MPDSSPQKLRHLDRDLAMGWLIRQDAPQAKEIRDYIDRLRVLVRERDGLEEQLEAQEQAIKRAISAITLDYYGGSRGRAVQILREALNPAKRSS